MKSKLLKPLLICFIILLIFRVFWGIISAIDSVQAIIDLFEVWKPLGLFSNEEVFDLVLSSISTILNLAFNLFLLIFIILNFSNVNRFLNSLVETIKKNRAESKEKRLAKKQADLEREIAEKQAALDEMKKQ